MSARVLNPAMMPDVGRPTGGRAAPNRAALARVRRDLFGPVDHAAARALAERELRAQSLLDAERWGFDFQLEIPKANSRYEWEPVTDQDVVPEPYALRGMPYIRKHAPSTPRKQSFNRETSPINKTLNSSKNPRNNRCNGLLENTTTLATAKTRSSSSSTPTMMMTATATTTMISVPITIESAERTPPQESRVPEMGRRVLNEEGDTNESQVFLESRKKIFIVEQATTPVIPVPPRKQSSITDFMKSRKRTLNGTTKSMIEPPEKITRNAGQIRS